MHLQVPIWDSEPSPIRAPRSALGQPLVSQQQGLHIHALLADCHCTGLVHIRWEAIQQGPHRLQWSPPH
eukprot:11226393-Lingulodinium_polyedra.AAC.1